MRFLIRIICAGILVTFASLAHAQSTDNSPAKAVISGQINAFKSQDHEGAFSYAAPAIRGMFGSTDRFIGMVRSGYGAIYGAQSWTFGRFKSQGSELYQEVMLVGPAGRNWVALYTLRKQADGTWKIAGVQIKPGEARST